MNTRRVAAEQDKTNSVSGLMRAANGQGISRQNLTLHERRRDSFSLVAFSPIEPHTKFDDPVSSASTLHVNPATDQGSAPFDFGIANTFVQWTRCLASGLTFQGDGFPQFSLKRSENDSFERTSPETMVRSSMFVVEAR